MDSECGVMKGKAEMNEDEMVTLSIDGRADNVN